MRNSVELKQVFVLIFSLMAIGLFSQAETRSPVVHASTSTLNSSSAQEFDQTAEDAKFILNGIHLPGNSQEKETILRESKNGGLGACMRKIYPDNPGMAQPSGWSKITLSNESCDSALTLVVKFAHAALDAYVESLAKATLTKDLSSDPKKTQWITRSQPTRWPKNSADHRSLETAATKGINGCLGWMFGNDFEPKVLPDNQSFASIGEDSSEGCRHLSLVVVQTFQSSK